jgi:uncharacterized protein (DUF302 family)
MSYYFNTTLKNKSFEEAVAIVTEKLKEEGFGIITQIDVKETFKKKLGIGFKNYLILGACNPAYAHKAIEAEDKVGVFLPCNVVVEENAAGNIEVSAVDPIASMSSIKNESLGVLAQDITNKLKQVITKLENS